MNLAFPWRFDHRGRTAESGDDRYVRELIEAVLFTAPGERVMRPDFGSGVAQLLFQPNSPELAGTVEMLVHGALTQWLSELITVSEVRVEAEESTLRVNVSYARRGEDRQQIQTFSLGTPS
jgi:phage baseplate assembly protein W